MPARHDLAVVEQLLAERLRYFEELWPTFAHAQNNILITALETMTLLFTNPPGLASQ